MSEANKNQVGGGHYKDKSVEVWDFIHRNGIGYLAGNAIKYLVRYKEKGGVEDLRKAKHYIDKLIEEEISLEDCGPGTLEDCGPGRGYVDQG